MGLLFRRRSLKARPASSRPAPRQPPPPAEPAVAVPPQFIEGSLADQSIAVVLQLLGMSKSCGRLTIAGPGDVARIGLAHGWILSASRDFGPKVGDELIARGILSPGDLDAVLALQRRKRVPQPLGDILAELGLVDSDVMNGIVRGHVLDILREAEVLKVGSFRFEEQNELTRARALPDSLRIERLLEELADRKPTEP